MAKSLPQLLRVEPIQSQQVDSDIPRRAYDSPQQPGRDISVTISGCLNIRSLAVLAPSAGNLSASMSHLLLSQVHLGRGHRVDDWRAVVAGEFGIKELVADFDELLGFIREPCESVVWWLGLTFRAYSVQLSMWLTASLFTYTNNTVLSSSRAALKTSTSRTFATVYPDCSM